MKNSYSFTNPAVKQKCIYWDLCFLLSDEFKSCIRSVLTLSGQTSE